MTDEPEFDPDTPGPPREVHEDAAARERSMTAEEWARELAWTISGTTFHGHDDFVHKVRAIATKTIAKAQSQAHAAGKAEGAAEERAKLDEWRGEVRYVRWDIHEREVEQERVACAQLAESTRLDFPDNMETSAAREALDYLAAAIRQRSEAPDDR